MDIIAQLFKEFWMWRRQNRITPGAVALYLAILDYFDPQTVQEGVRIDTDELIAVTGLGRNALYGCRKELIEAGLISVERGRRGQLPLHILCNNFGINMQNETEKDPCISTKYGTNNDEIPRTSTKYGTNNDEIPRTSTEYGTNNDEIPRTSTKYGTNNDEIPRTSTKYGTNSTSFLYLTNSSSSNSIISTTTKGTTIEVVEREEDEMNMHNSECNKELSDGIAEFENKLRPIANAVEGEMLQTLVKEHGDYEFIGAVRLAAKFKRRGGQIWKWIQTVLDNGDWERGYKDFEQDTPYIEPISPDELFRDELFKHG